MVTPPFDWESFETPESIAKQKQQAAINPVRKPEKIGAPLPEEFDWGNFDTPNTYDGEPETEDEEGFLPWLARTTSGQAASAGAGYLGRYGNIEEFTKNILDPKNGEASFFQRLVGPDKWSNLIRGPTGQQQMLPTSADIKSKIDTATEGYTSPRTKGERIGQTITGDIASAARRGPNARSTITNTFGIPIGANVVKEAVEGMGFDETDANRAKLATWLIGATALNINARRYGIDLVRQGRDSFDNSYRVNVPGYQQRINDTARNFLMNDPRSQLARQQIAGLQDDIQSGRTTIRDLFTRYDAINATMKDRGLFDLSNADRQAAIRYLNQVKSLVRREIEDVGRTNPQGLRMWQDGMEALAVGYTADAAKNMMQRVLNGPYAKLVQGSAVGLLSGGIGYLTKSPAITGGLAVGANLAIEAGKTAYKMGRSPVLRRYYFNAIRNATEGNQAGFTKNAIELNRALDKLKEIGYK